MNKIRKVLIANRGEIAVRVLRTCREMGIRTVAVYSEADRTALHTRLADESYCVGPPPAGESYLQQDTILKIARQADVDAIHPGYGFLSENPVFAEKVEKTGLVFIGPPASAMRIMGDKTEARKAMQKAGVPIVPGTAEPLSSVEQATKTAAQVGYPVLLKAAAGGGGKGMRIVESEKDMASSFRSASSEAQSAFGDGRVYIEKYLEQPRHIEFQVFADQHGNAIHLGERECSIQRRHQKVIEEAPSAILDPEMRTKMGEAAVKAALACGYTNAGTIEFLVDKHRNFYFLEMNTRLQVEHPVTEMITGVDLVKEQIRIAEGEAISFTQDDLKIHGHSIEVRVYAEDPTNNFLPDIGKLHIYQKPEGEGIRVDDGFEEGMNIPIYYDPMISKLIVWAGTREEAINRMSRALQEYKITGVKTSIPFLARIMEAPVFRSGKYNTHFIEENKEFLFGQHDCDGVCEDIALIATYLEHTSKLEKIKTGANAVTTTSRWKDPQRQAYI